MIGQARRGWGCLIGQIVIKRIVCWHEESEEWLDRAGSLGQNIWFGLVSVAGWLGNCWGTAEKIIKLSWQLEFFRLTSV